MTNPADMVPFAKTMGITITAMDRDKVCGEMLVAAVGLADEDHARGRHAGGGGDPDTDCAVRGCRPTRLSRDRRSPAGRPEPVETPLPFVLSLSKHPWRSPASFDRLRTNGLMDQYIRCFPRPPPLR